MSLSVVMTAYNRPREVVRSLECLRAQSVDPGGFEVVVVDDGSTDDTGRVLDDALRHLPPTFRAIHKSNGGPASARNAGVAQATGDVVLLLQDDIFATPELVARHAAAHAARADPVVVLGQTRWSEDLSRSPFMDYLMEGDQFAFHWITDPEHVPYNFFYSSNVSFPRAAYEAVGGFDEELPYAAWEDTHLGLKLTRSGLRMVYEPLALAHHHHPTTLASFLGKRRLSGRASTVLFRKAPECGPMMRYDRRPSAALLALAALPYHVVRALLVLAEGRGMDGGLPARARRRLYRLLLDYEYFAGVAEGLPAAPARRS
jgi:glycosyltransferase involved in cell wall biosynthesis